MRTLKSCPFCGAKPAGIAFETHDNGTTAGYVVEVRHKDQCFIEHLSCAYYCAAEDCADEWNRRAKNA